MGARVVQRTPAMGATMKNDERDEFFTRESIQRLLSDREVSSVSTAESVLHLVDGEEFIDLEHLERGVRRADTSMTPTPMGRVLTRKAVSADTWTEILHKLSQRREAVARAGL
jgi:hypothetical protein